MSSKNNILKDNLHKTGIHISMDTLTGLTILFHYVYAHPATHRSFKPFCIIRAIGLPRSCYNSVYHFIQKNQKNEFYQAKEYIDFTRKDTAKHSEQDILNIINPLLMELYHVEQHSVLSDKEELIFVNTSSLIEQTHGRISREQLEKRPGYNSDYLNRVVKKYTGLSLMEYGRTFCFKEAARH